jgi:dynein heavy chain, axonemal
LQSPIFPHLAEGQVEKWLSQLENQMRNSIKKVITSSLIDYPESQEFELNRQPEQPNQETDFRDWLGNWQSQVLVVVQQIKWTKSVESALKSVDSYKQLVNLYHLKYRQLETIVKMVREKMPELMRMTLSTLIVTEVHARDIVENLARENTKSKEDFNWVNKMRFYNDKHTESVHVEMVMTKLTYNNEFLGNTGRLVITPLTDRCYRTLMSALTLNLGGAPEGPAGTGKTETTKDLAKSLAIHCLVFNCGEGLDIHFMSKLFKGLAAGGSWSCLDEFNRIELEVLSVIA